MSEDGLSEPCDEPSMELFVESLTGTSFEMRVYSTDTVLDIKNKIFRVEGIPVPQQNLLFQMKELNDHSRLSDLGIVNGSTLRLVTAMRGGPISTRRWTSDHMVWKDLKDLIEHTREELGDKLGTKVSVLVFKEGEVIKWLRVIENEDGSYSPYTEQRAIAPPCTSSGGSGGGGGGGCGVSNGGGSIGSRSGNKHYQHHKTSAATDGATMSSNTIDFQELMQFKQHASALSSYYHQQHHHHHNNNHSQHQHASDAGSSAVISGVGDHHHHQQQQQQRQQVYRRLEDDVRMKGRVNMLKARMQRAKRNKGKLVMAPPVSGEITGDLTVAEEIAIGRRNDNLVLTAVLNDDLIDDNEEGLDEAFKPDLRLEALLRTLQNSETLGTTTSERYTLASKYHRRTQSRNNHVLQLDTSQLPDDDLTLFKPIPTGHGSSKHTSGSTSTYLMGTSTATNTTGPTLSTNNSHSGLNLLLMDCPAATAATTSSSSSSSNSDSGSTSSSSSCSANDLEVALKEKHRSSRLRLHATASGVVKNAGTASDASDSGDVDAIGKCIKTSVIGRRLSNSVDLAGSLNQPTTTLTQQSATSANNNNSYVCTNLHVFEPQHDILAPTLRHDSNSPKRRQGSKANIGNTAVFPTTIANMVASAAGDYSSNSTRERLSLPETKRRAKIGRLLNTTTTPGSGETSDSDDGLWSCQTTPNGGNRLRHYRATTKRLILPDTTSLDKGKCGPDADASSPLDGDQLQQHVILPDIWEHHCSPSSTTTMSSRGGGGGGGLLCARTTTNTSPNTTADAANAAAAAAAMVDATIEDSAGAAAAACLRDYMDLDSEFDKMFSELRSAVPIPSAIPPQYAPKDCQLYLGTPVLPRPAPTPSPASEASNNKSVAAVAGSATAAAHRLSPLGCSLPYHVGLCTSSTAAGPTTRRSPLYHRRTTGTIHMAPMGGQSVGATTDDDRTSIAAAARNMLEKVQRATASEIGNVAGTVGDKTMRQRRRRYSTDDCEFTLERLQNDYVPDRFDYSDFESYAADVDDMIDCYGQEAVVNARWMEAAAAAASATGSRSGGTSPPGQRHRNSMRLRTSPLHRESTTTSTSDHLCIAEQIQRLGLGLDPDAEYKSETQVGGATTTTTSLGSTVGSRLGTTVGRMITDDRNNTINTREFAHSKFMSTGLVPSGGNAGHNTKLPMLVEQRKQQPEQSSSNASAVPSTVPPGATVAVPAVRPTVPRMRCARCNRKLNITNIYDCRCGRIFCAQHRYSEVHDCAHDYKTEGRRLLSQQNPLVTAPKLAKF